MGLGALGRGVEDLPDGGFGSKGAWPVHAWLMEKKHFSLSAFLHRTSPNELRFLDGLQLSQ